MYKNMDVLGSIYTKLAVCGSWCLLYYSVEGGGAERVGILFLIRDGEPLYNGRGSCSYVFKRLSLILDDFCVLRHLMETQIVCGN